MPAVISVQRRPVVARAQDVRRVVVEPVPVDGRVGRRRIVGRGLDQAHLAPRLERGWRDVLPVRPFVARELNQPVVGARPDEPLRLRRRRQGVDDAVRLGRRQPVHHGAPLRRRVSLGAREVGADRRPARAAVGRLQHDLRAVVQRARVLRREDDRRRPVEPVAQVGARRAERRLGPRRDVLHLSGAPHEAEQVAVRAAAVDHVRVAPDRARCSRSRRRRPSASRAA